MAQKKSKRKTSKKIDSVKHKDKRKNIPTEELRDFVKEDETKPQQVKYPCPCRKFRPCLLTRVYVQLPTLEKLPEMIP